MTTLSTSLVESIGNDAVVAPVHLRDYSVDGATPEVAVLPRNVEAVSEVSLLRGQRAKGSDALGRRHSDGPGQHAPRR